MKVHDPYSNQMEKQYEDTDVRRLLGKREWRNYDEMISWLSEEGDEDRRFTPGEVRRMIEDLSKLKQRGTPFITDPDQLYQEMRK